MVTWIERTGYPQEFSENIHNVHYCGECCCELEDDIYENDRYEYLCEDCLLMLHKKRW